MRRTALSFAIVAAVCLGMTAYIASQIVHFGLTHRYSLTATFDDATNLHNGNPVRLAGVEVGLVGGVKLVDGRAQVRFSVNKTVVLPADTAVAVRWVNLIGQRELYLYPGTSTSRLKNGDRVTHTRSVVDLGQLFNQLGPLTQALDPKQVNTLLETLVSSFNGNIGNVDTIVADLKTVLGTLASRKQTISQLLGDYQTLTDAVAHRDLQIQTAVDNLVALSAAFAQSDKVLDGALVELPKLSTNLQAFLGASAGDLGRIIDSLAVVTGVTHERVSDLEGILHNLPPTLADLFSVSAQGHWLNLDVLCVSINKPPCPTPMVIPAAFKGSGPLVTKASFLATLVGSTS
jgi:phospholipid/cholesterol/gamma-HCH transport system substrate-binding protein